MVPLPSPIRVPPPEQRGSYGKALGEFLVAFNSIENILRELVELSLIALARSDYWRQLKRATLVELVRYMTLLPIANKKLPSIGLQAGDHLVTHCDGGGRAALAAIAAVRAGFDDFAVYYLSFSDWAKDETCPIV
jgi:rhodanese-related sulfurtransferase